MNNLTIDGILVSRESLEQLRRILSIYAPGDEDSPEDAAVAELHGLLDAPAVDRQEPVARCRQSPVKKYLSVELLRTDMKDGDLLYPAPPEVAALQSTIAQQKNLIDDLRTCVDDVDRLVRELDVLLHGEAGAAAQASLCDIVAQVRMYREEPGTGSLQLLALVADQVVGRVYHTPQTATVELNSCGRALADGAPLYSRPADALTRYVRAPSRKDPKYHEEWPEIDGGPVFDGATYCNDLFAALKRYNVIVAETMPDGAVDE